MDALKYLLHLLYKVYLIVQERLFLIPPPGHPPPHPSSIMGEGGGGDEFQQEYQLEKNKQFQTPPVYASGSGEVLVGKRTSDYKTSPLLEEQRISLCETLDRVLNTGVVVHGDITISVANIDLIYIGLRALLTSVETARQIQARA